MIRACIRCRRACARLWCDTCRARGEASSRRAAKKPQVERDPYRDLDMPVYLASVGEALEAML